MRIKRATAALSVFGLLATPTGAFAIGAGVGCTNLPEYYRAVGTIENGPYSCGMSMEEARRILARPNPEAGADQPGAPAPQPRKRRHRRKPPPS